MYRLIYLVSLTVAFLRDYVYPSDNLASLILTVFFIEASIDVVTRPIFQRSSNIAFAQNYYFANDNKYLVFFFCGCFISLLLMAPIFLGWINSYWVLPCAWLMLAIRFSNIQLISNSKYNLYHLFELLKNVSLAAYIVSESYTILSSSLLAVASLQWISNLIINNEEICVETTSFKLVIDNAKKDMLLYIQIGLSSSAFLVDKYISGDNGDLPLMYVLITKYVIFSIGAFNVLNLQVFHLESRGRLNELNVVDVFRAGLPSAALILVSYLAFFGIFVWWLPVGAELSFDGWVFFLGFCWLVIMIVKETVVRVCYFKNDFRRYALVGIWGFVLYYLTLFILGTLDVYFAISMQSLVAVFITLGLFKYVIRQSYYS